MVITASHNPPIYNGFKAYWSDGAAVVPPHDENIIREVRSRYVWAEHPPASTLVGVSALVGLDWLVEIEAVAVIAE